jgi:hypothetical protein
MSIFDTAMSVLFSGPMSEAARYRPRNGPDFDITVIPAAAGDMDMNINQAGMVLPETMYEANAAQFTVTPTEGDTMLIGTVSYIVKSVRRVNDGMVWRFSMGATR